MECRVIEHLFGGCESVSRRRSSCAHDCCRYCWSGLVSFLVSFLVSLLSLFFSVQSYMFGRSVVSAVRLIAISCVWCWLRLFCWLFISFIRLVVYMIVLGSSVIVVRYRYLGSSVPILVDRSCKFWNLWRLWRLWRAVKTVKTVKTVSIDRLVLHLI